MASEKINLARPGNAAARKALKKHEKKGAGVELTTLGFLYWMCFLWSQMAHGAARTVALVLLSVCFSALLAGGVRWLHTSKAYRRHVEAGNIITVDAYLIEAWDALRKEEDVALTATEREQQIRLLFSAAEDLQPDLSSRARALGEPELEEQQLLAEARIRARLLRDVTTLRGELETDRELAALNAAATDWATEAEVDKQLAILRGRKATPDADPQEGSGA